LFWRRRSRGPWFQFLPARTRNGTSVAMLAMPANVLFFRARRW
jgi:hypothetical protein